MDWLERADWTKRSSEFGALVDATAEVRMEFVAPVSFRLWELWIGLKEHPNILVARAPQLLRYAALDWTHSLLDLDADPATGPRLMTYGMVLLRVFEFIAAAENGWFCNPLIKFDLEGAMRIAFSNTRAELLPPEFADRWPHCDQRALVFVIGQALATLIVPTRTITPIKEIVQRCIERDPAKRYPNLYSLEAVFRTAGARAVPPARVRPARTTWNLLESGLGFLAIGEPAAALDRFTAQLVDRTSTHQQALVAYTRAFIPNPKPGALLQPVSDCIPKHVLEKLNVSTWPPRTAEGVRIRLPWDDVRLVGRALENERNFLAALELYRNVPLDDPDLLALEVATARCQLALGKVALAEEHVDAALARDPAQREAIAMRVAISLRKKAHHDALAACDVWLGLEPENAHAVYTRGKCLLGLRRLVEARDAFDRACAMDPRLEEAMWLRTTVDRSLKKLRANVGTAVPMPVNLPVGPLRDALVAGRIDDAIVMLHEPSQLLGDLLLYVGRFEEALRVFEQLEGEAAIQGKARALFDLGRTDEALAVFEQFEPGFTAIRR